MCTFFYFLCMSAWKELGSCDYQLDATGLFVLFWQFYTRRWGVKRWSGYPNWLLFFFLSTSNLLPFICAWWITHSHTSCTGCIVYYLGGTKEEKKISYYVPSRIMWQKKQRGQGPGLCDIESLVWVSTLRQRIDGQESMGLDLCVRNKIKKPWTTDPSVV